MGRRSSPAAEDFLAPPAFGGGILVGGIGRAQRRLPGRLRCWLESSALLIDFGAGRSCRSRRYVIPWYLQFQTPEGPGVAPEVPPERKFSRKTVFNSAARFSAVFVDFLPPRPYSRVFLPPPATIDGLRLRVHRTREEAGEARRPALACSPPARGCRGDARPLHFPPLVRRCTTVFAPRSPRCRPRSC